MKKKTVLLFTALCTALTFSLHAKNMTEFMAVFYSDLADIVENNTGSPEECVTKIRRYVDEHRDDFSAFEDDVLAAGSTQKVKETGALNNQRLTQAIERFARVIASFAELHPDKSQQIMEALTSIVPKASGHK